MQGSGLFTVRLPAFSLIAVFGLFLPFNLTKAFLQAIRQLCG
jgi:hypothetical protein